MVEQELYGYLKLHFPEENEHCEWKAFGNLRYAVSGSAGDDVISYVSAISNMEGGDLVIGVEDKSLRIIGIQNLHDYTPEDFPFRIIGNCSHLPSEGLRVELFITTDTNKTVWVLHIPKHLPRQPVIAHRKAWQRSGDSLLELTQSRREAILMEPLHTVDDWSAGICPMVTISQLDEMAITKAKFNYKVKNPRITEEVDGWDTVTFLAKSRLMVNGKITRAAVLLLGKPEATAQLNPVQPQISWVLYSKEKIEKDYQHFYPPYINAVDEVFAKIRNLKYRYLKEGTLFPDEVDQYDQQNIKEALSNCIAHKDYNLGSRVSVAENEDGYISFSNPGSFLPRSIQEVIESEEPPSFYRNTLLVTTIESFNMIDSIGSGIKRMFRVQRERFFPMPDYDFSGNKVKVTLTGKVLDMDYARVLARNPELSLNQIILLDNVQKRKPLLEPELKLLRAKGLIEGKKPNIIISAKVAQTTGQKAVYTRNKAFSKQQYFDWIMQAIQDHGSLSRKDIEELVWSKLSDLYDEKQKKTKITNLIAELRRNEKIENVGSDAAPKWVLKEQKGDT